ncbi:hypothetical protein ILUMI_27288 [Ignelater luminosus]|uniref:Uncharacterized protein n=1 Tax=Ignelater luminosus TaxID=2038154 RepID=A0A8K0C6G0_IGNLU|nr:hypothetical protein ILUMI_27288 [Ignelater luminosus]
MPRNRLRPTTTAKWSKEEKCMTDNINLPAKLVYGVSSLEIRCAAHVYAEKHNYPLGTNTVTVMNDSTVNLMNKDQATPTPKSDNLPGTTAHIENTTVFLSELTNSLSGPSSILTPSKTILFPFLLPTATKARKRANTKQYSAILTATSLKGNLENKEIKRNEKLSKDSWKTDKKKINIANKKTVQEYQETKDRFRIFFFSSSSIDEQDLENICDDDSDDDIFSTNEQET